MNGWVCTCLPGDGRQVTWSKAGSVFLIRAENGHWVIIRAGKRHHHSLDQQDRTMPAGDLRRLAVLLNALTYGEMIELAGALALHLAARHSDMEPDDLARMWHGWTVAYLEPVKEPNDDSEILGRDGFGGEQAGR